MTNIIEISPYVREAARKAALIGAKADVRPEHYTFQRAQKLYTPPLERSAPIKACWSDWLAGVLIFIAIGCLIFWTM